MSGNTNTPPHLRLSEVKLRGLFEMSPLGIALTNMQGRYLEFNDAFQTICGYTAEELNSLDYWTLTPKKYEADEMRQLELLRSTGRYGPYEKEYRRKDGRLIPLRLNGMLITGEDGEQYIWSIVENITEQKASEHNLNEANALLNSIISNIPTMVFMKDAKELRFELFNRAGEELLGYAARDLLDKNDYDFFPKEQADFFTAEDRKVLSLHKAIDIPEEKITNAAGEVRYLHTKKIALHGPDDQPTHLLGISLDITERRQNEEELRIAAVAFETHEAILITDSDANIIRVNRAFERITGYSEADVVGKNPRMFSSGRHDKVFYEKMWRQLLDAGTWSGEVWDRHKSGSIYPKEVTITAVKNAKGETTQYVSIFTDITERKRAEQEIHNLAFYDALTSLPNRRLFMNRLHVALTVAARTHQYGAVMFLDLDKFKTLNDTLGHDYGDLLLIEVANRLRYCVRESDTVARLGGDEFVILIEDVSQDESEATQAVAIVAEKIRSVLATHYQLKEHTHHTTPSVGVCVFNGEITEVDEVVKRADLAMYQAKDSGRNRVRFFDPQMQHSVESRAALEASFRDALTHESFRLYYQLQVDAQRKPIGVEALIRWIHPKNGIVLPEAFIPFAEESSLIQEIGAWVLDAACRQLSAWSRNEHTRDLVLAVNISAHQFKLASFVGMIASLVAKHGINASLLRLELTENVALDGLDSVIAKMNLLRNDLGISISLDDFGVGYSSLSYLKQLPIQQIKIDKSFVRAMHDHPRDKLMLKALIDIAENFGLNAIAEGIESEAQLAELRSLGCSSFQGYLFGEPMQVEDFESSLAAARI